MAKTEVIYEDEESGRDFKVEFDLRFYRENYGADADGNRGVMTTFSELEGIEIFEAFRTDPTNKAHKRIFWLKTTEDFIKQQDEALMKRIDAWIEGAGMEEAEGKIADEAEDDGDEDPYGD